jgi:hypothetical protein
LSGHPSADRVHFPALTREKLKTLLAEYGRLAVWTYLVIWLVVLSGFVIAIKAGFHTDSGAGGLGVVGAAWLATKLTQPLRIAGTLALTPVVAAVVKRFTARRQPQASPPAAD